MSIRDARTVMADIAALGLAPEAMALMMELAASLASSAQPAAPAKSKAALRTQRWREKNERLKASQNVTGDADVTVGDGETSQVTLGDGAANKTPPFPTPAPFLPPDPQQTPTPTHTPVENTPARVGDGSDLFGGDGDEPPAKPKKGKKPNAEDEPFVLPDDIDAEAWAGFEEMRKRKKAPMTDRARRGVVKKLRAFAEDGHPPGDVLDQSTINSYTDVYPLKENRSGTRNRSPNHGQHSTGFRDPVLGGLAFGDGP